MTQRSTGAGVEGHDVRLHILKARMRGGVMNKARRGELKMMPPVGLAYQDNGVLGLDAPAALRKAVSRDALCSKRKRSAREHFPNMDTI